MHKTLTTLIDRFDAPELAEADVILWSCPVPSFGDLSSSQVATLGLNPSNMEFVDKVGNELHTVSRRFHTLKSLGIRSWSETDARHLRMIINSCQSYFEGNPYDRWFKILDKILIGTNTSYYEERSKACHLDLIPYATKLKWMDLTTHQRSLLLDIAGDTLGLLVRDSPIRILILNGKSVVDQFQLIADVRLEEQVMPTWTLNRRGKSGVKGAAYTGVVNSLSGIEFGREILILGFNHNLQSSFGVTTKVIHSIRDWISQTVSDAGL